MVTDLVWFTSLTMKKILHYVTSEKFFTDHPCDVKSVYTAPQAS
ncbi:hypothetical protein T01_12862 [Trichinella spiralis]|uniref:Uncharacterized protein n=1 Tax=Trichinella spiralis TaxID=6334 RepID=A0A0V0ZH85_TRISP|nr:hypothetical protein T01_12862 [Trichinella spiralis]